MEDEGKNIIYHGYVHHMGCYKDAEAVRFVNQKYYISLKPDVPHFTAREAV